MMGTWILVMVSLLTFGLAIIKYITSRNPQNKKIHNLPPGPPTILVLAKLLLNCRSLMDIKYMIGDFHARYGPNFTLRISSQPFIFIADRHLAHEAFVQKGATLSDRLPVVDPLRLMSSDAHTVATSPYGPLWRLLRKNQVSGVLHPSRTKQFNPDRQWTLRLLIDQLREQAKTAGGVTEPHKIFDYAFLRLIVILCFGEKPEEGVIRRIDEAQEILHMTVTRFNVFQFFPRITKNILFRKRWNQIVSNRKILEDICLSLLRARQGNKKLQNVSYCYIDSLIELELPNEGGRKLSWDEISSLCLELLGAGKDATSSSLQWIMANIVKRPDIQFKLTEEIKTVMAGRGAEEVVEEEDLQNMKYLNAVVMEGMRRHPTTYFVLPHAASEDTQVGQYTIPKKSPVILLTTEINYNADVWAEPMEFKPERFLAEGEGEDVDITGSREIKMITFGVGRRICPGMNFAVVNIKYLVANLVREFEWKAVDGEEVEMTETIGTTVVVMRKPLRAQIIPRMN